MAYLSGNDSMTASTPLLGRFILHEGHNADALGEAIAPYLGENAITTESGEQSFQALMNLHRLQKTSLFYGKFEQPFSVDIRESTSFLHGFPIHGNAQHVNNGCAISDSPVKGAVGGPGPLRLSYGADFEIFALFIRPEALSGALSALVGMPVSGALKLDKANHEGGGETPALRTIVSMMISEVDREGAGPSPLLLAELEQAALVAFLCGTTHNHSHLLVAPARNGAPWQLRRVEDYIEANWDQPITVDALAAVTNASARSVFNSFKQHRGYSPMQFVKEVRLRRAHEMLAAQNSGMSVTDVALACGFGNLGHFANDYFKAYGEKPSATRNQSNRRA
jgi:AraC-like DNA-binding protein